MNLLFLSNIFFFFNVYTKFLLLLINRNCTIKLYNNILFQCSRIILRKYPHSSENIKIVTYKPITSKFMKKYIYIYIFLTRIHHLISIPRRRPISAKFQHSSSKGIKDTLATIFPLLRCIT